MTYMFIFLLNRSEDYPYTTSDGIWDYGVMFVAHGFMGAAFLTIGFYVAPKFKKEVLFCLAGIAFALISVMVFLTFYAGFTWVSFVSEMCILVGVIVALGYHKEDDDILQ